MNSWIVATVKRSRKRKLCAPDVLVNVAAVINGLKPSYLLDYAISTLDDIDSWLCNISKTLRPQCRLSILNVENQLFLVDVDRLRAHLTKIIHGKCSSCNIVVDVSSTVKVPKVKQYVEGRLIVKECAQMVFDFITSTVANDAHISIEPPVGMNRTTLYGVLLGYPVLYWYKDVSGAGNCLSMIPLRVTTVTASANLRNCDIYSFSIPETSFHECNESVNAWYSELVEKFEQLKDYGGTIENLCMDEKTVIQSAVCL